MLVERGKEGKPKRQTAGAWQYAHVPNTSNISVSTTSLALAKPSVGPSTLPATPGKPTSASEIQVNHPPDEHETSNVDRGLWDPQKWVHVESAGMGLRRLCPRFLWLGSLFPVKSSQACGNICRGSANKSQKTLRPFNFLLVSQTTRLLRCPPRPGQPRPKDWCMFKAVCPNLICLYPPHPS